MNTKKIRDYLTEQKRIDESNLITRFKEMTEDDLNSLYPSGLHLSNGDILVRTNLQIKDYLKEMGE